MNELLRIVLQWSSGYGKISNARLSELGRMAEWFKAVVLKTTVGDKPTGGSNPSPSALLLIDSGRSHSLV